jgi:hypothetical protein
MKYLCLLRVYPHLKPHSEFNSLSKLLIAIEHVINNDIISNDIPSTILNGVKNLSNFEMILNENC